MFKENDTAVKIVKPQTPINILSHRTDFVMLHHGLGLTLSLWCLFRGEAKLCS